MITAEELLRQAEAKRKEARMLLQIGREMLSKAEQERLIERSHRLELEAAQLEASASKMRSDPN